MRQIQKPHELVHKVWPEPSSIYFFFGGGGVVRCGERDEYQTLMNWPIYVSTSMTLE